MSILSDELLLPSLSMSGVAAVRHIRAILEVRPAMTIADAAVAARDATADGGGHDYDFGEAILVAVPSLPDRFEECVRSILSELIRRERPSWLSIAAMGRNRLRSVLDPNLIQVFAAGQLFDAVPSEEVVTWWDDLAAMYRAAQDERNVARGRHAEELSLQFERARLQAADCPLTPEWTAMEDAGAGFDILSYVLDGGEWQSQAIEVKATASSADRFYLTRNEFETATKMGDRWNLHLWHEGATVPVVYSSAEVVSNSPVDVGTSHWEQCVIILGGN